MLGQQEFYNQQEYIPPTSNWQQSPEEAGQGWLDAAVAEEERRRIEYLHSLEQASTPEEWQKVIAITAKRVVEEGRRPELDASLN